MDWAGVTRWVAQRGGVARLGAVAARAGCQTRTVRQRATAQGWWWPFPQVVALPGVEDRPLTWARAAIEHARGTTGDPDRDLVALCGATALHHLGVSRAAPTRVELAIPPARWLTPQGRIRQVRTTAATSSQVVVHAGVPVLRGPALLRLLSGHRTAERLRADAIDLQRVGHLDLDALGRHLATEPRFPGRPALVGVLRDLAGVGRVDSPLEFEARRRFRDAGIEFDRGQVEVPTRAPWPLHVDLGRAALRFGIEVDSLAFHSDRASLERDAARANAIALVDDGWRVLHMTWRDLGAGWPAFLALVRQVLAEQAARFDGRS